MKELRRNEYLDLLEANALIFEEKEHSIVADIPKIGQTTYYPKSNKLLIHKENKWEDDGYYFIKNTLKNVC